MKTTDLLRTQLYSYHKAAANLLQTLPQVYCKLYRKATATFYQANEDCYKAAAK